MWWVRWPYRFITTGLSDRFQVGLSSDKLRGIPGPIVSVQENPVLILSMRVQRRERANVYPYILGTARRGVPGPIVMVQEVADARTTEQDKRSRANIYPILAI